jgi:hypothetical protein
MEAQCQLLLIPSSSTGLFFAVTARESADSILLAPFFGDDSTDFLSTLPRFTPEAMKANQALAEKSPSQVGFPSPDASQKKC